MKKQDDLFSWRQAMQVQISSRIVASVPATLAQAFAARAIANKPPG